MNKKVIAVVIIVVLIAGAVALYLIKPEFLTGNVLGGKKIKVEKVIKKGTDVGKKTLKKKVTKKVVKQKTKVNLKGNKGNVYSGGTEADPRATGTEADPVTGGGNSSGAVDSRTTAPDSVPTI